MGDNDDNIQGSNLMRMRRSNQPGQPQSYGYQLKMPEMKFTPRRMHLYPDPETLWIAPLQARILRSGQEQVLKISGMLIPPKDRKDYLMQLPEPEASSSAGLALYTDNTPDFFTQDSQFSVGFQGFGFKALGKLYLQGTADHPNSPINLSAGNGLPADYNQYQVTVATDDLKLIVLKKSTVAATLALTGGVDTKTGKVTVGGQVTVKNSILQSLSLNINNIGSNGNRRISADSVQVSATFSIPGT